MAAYYGGWVDSILRSIVDVGLTVPNLMILIVVALTLRQGMTVNVMALVIASLAWLYPARTIRSQVLTLRERAYVQIARLSGTSGPGIIVKELMPNLLPYLMASLVGSVSAAILASIGLDVLGLGVFEAPTLGMTLYWVNFTGAVINGWWWWWLAPIVVVGILFIALFLISIGLDEIANPRLRRQVLIPDGSPTVVWAGPGPTLGRMTSPRSAPGTTSPFPVKKTGGGSIHVGAKKRRCAFAADSHRRRAARCKTAGALSRTRAFRRGRIFPLPGAIRIGIGDRADQQSRVGMFRLANDLLDVASFGDQAAIENNDVLTDLIGGGQIVRDVDQRDPEFIVQLAQAREDGRPERSIDHGDRFVGDYDARAGSTATRATMIRWR